MIELEAEKRASAQTIRDKAIALIAGGNSLESVASVFGMSAHDLDSLIQHADARLPVGALRTTSARPWHTFPGTIVYRCGNYAGAFALTIGLVGVIFLGFTMFSSGRQVRTGYSILWLTAVICCLVAVVQAFRSARVKRFEMRSDAIARYTLAGCTVLNYAQITGVSMSRLKGSYYIELLTRHGVGLTITPSVEQVDDVDLREWLDAIPQCESALANSLPMKALMWCNYLLVCGALVFFTVKPGITAIHDMAHAAASEGWPTADGIVTKSVALTGGGKSCREGLRLHYSYTVAQQRYDGKNYQFGGPCIADARRIAATNPVGEPIKVHYDAGNPSDSVIVPGMTSSNTKFNIFALFVTGIYFLLMIFYRPTK